VEFEDLLIVDDCQHTPNLTVGKVRMGPARTSSLQPVREPRQQIYLWWRKPSRFPSLCRSAVNKPDQLEGYRPGTPERS